MNSRQRPKKTHKQTNLNPKPRKYRSNIKVPKKIEIITKDLERSQRFNVFKVKKPLYETPIKMVVTCDQDIEYIVDAIFQDKQEEFFPMSEEYEIKKKCFRSMKEKSIQKNINVREKNKVNNDITNKRTKRKPKKNVISAKSLKIIQQLDKEGLINHGNRAGARGSRNLNENTYVQPYSETSERLFNHSLKSTKIRNLHLHPCFSSL